MKINKENRNGPHRKRRFCQLLYAVFNNFVIFYTIPLLSLKNTNVSTTIEIVHDCRHQ